MNDIEIFIQIEKLFNKYNLGKLTAQPKQITGGLMHRMYQVITEGKKYAVKEMNPSIMKRVGVVENIINSERVATALKGIVPAITAIQFKDESLLMLDGKYYMMFEWFDGMSIFPPDITNENCRDIGRILGKIHSAKVMIPDIKMEFKDPKLFDWNKYLLLGQETGAKWTKELSLVIDDLIKWNQESNDTSISLSRNFVLSHGDLDPKNVMWKDNNPCIIDWESAGYVNPYQELLDVLNNWTNDGMGKLNKDKFKALYDAYIEVVGNSKVDWNTVFTNGYGGMLAWLDYSFKRSLEIECSSLEEKNLGTEQVFGTITALRQYSLRINLLKDWLNA